MHQSLFSLCGIDGILQAATLNVTPRRTELRLRAPHAHRGRSAGCPALESTPDPTPTSAAASADRRFGPGMMAPMQALDEIPEAVALSRQIRAGQPTQGSGVSSLPQITENTSDIVPRLPIRGNLMAVFRHGALPGVVSGEHQAEIALEAIQQEPQVGDATANIL